MQKKAIMSYVVLIVILSLLFLTGPIFAAGSQEKLDEDTVILNFWRAGTDELETHYWESAIEMFEKSHPNIKIKFSSVPWGNEIETKLSTAYVGGTFPDVISFSIASIAGHADAGHYAALDGFIEDWDGKNDMIDHIQNLGKYNGTTYGLGIFPDPRIFVWRKDLFEKAGLDPERPPQTWEELAEYAELLTEKDGGITVTGGFSIRSMTNNGDAAQDWQTFALQNGSKIIDVPNNKALFNNPKGVEAAQFLADMFMKGVDPQLGPNRTPFSEGRVAMAYDNPSAVAQLFRDNPELEGKVGFASPHSREKMATFAGLRLLFLGSKSEHKEEGFEFVKFILSAEETWRRYEVMKAPIVLESLKDKYIADNPIVNSAIYDAVMVGQGYPIVKYSFNYMELISTALQEAYYGKKTAAEAFEDAEDEFYKQLPSWLNN